MNAPERGEVWLADLGWAVKTRPAVVLSIHVLDQDRTLATLVAHATSLRGSRFEVAILNAFLKVGAFVAQNIVTQPLPKLVRRLGVLTHEEFAKVEDAVRFWLGLELE